MFFLNGLSFTVTDLGLRGHPTQRILKRDYFRIRCRIVSFYYTCYPSDIYALNAVKLEVINVIILWKCDFAGSWLFHLWGIY